MRIHLLASVISISMAACAQSGSDDGAVGSAVARITTVPPMVGCISISVVGSRTVTDKFDVTPGQPATLKLSNLPVGSDSFSASAFGSACSAIAGTQASWSSTAPFVAAISPGSITSLMLTLEPTGGATIGINFDTDGGTGGCGDGGCVGGDGGVPFDLASFGDGGGSFDGGLVDLAQPASDLAQPAHD